MYPNFVYPNPKAADNFLNIDFKAIWFDFH